MPPSLSKSHVLITKQKAAGGDAGSEIHAILQEISGGGNGTIATGKYSRREAGALPAHAFHKDAISRKRSPYERLDQLTVDLRAGR
jgi:hypothetical protein